MLLKKTNSNILLEQCTTTQRWYIATCMHTIQLCTLMMWFYVCTSYILVYMSKSLKAQICIRLYVNCANLFLWYWLRCIEIFKVQLQLQLVLPDAFGVLLMGLISVIPLDVPQDIRTFQHQKHAIVSSIFHIIFISFQELYLVSQSS